MASIFISLTEAKLKAMDPNRRQMHTHPCTKDPSPMHEWLNQESDCYVFLKPSRLDCDFLCIGYSTSLIQLRAMFFSLLPPATSSCDPQIFYSFAQGNESLRVAVEVSIVSVAARVIVRGVLGMCFLFSYGGTASGSVWISPAFNGVDPWTSLLY